MGRGSYLMNKAKIKKLLSTIREKSPLVHHITNMVTINDCANITLAVGASPVMAMSTEEVEEMVQLSDALVINFGTLQTETFKAMLIAGKMANEKRIPIIFDPVGVGATTFRKEKANELLRQVNMSVIRGNASEVYGLINEHATTRGVDAGHHSISSMNIAHNVSTTYNCVAVVSGKIDTVSNGSDMVQIENGSPLLPQITGTGCMTTSLIASFSGITDDYFSASIAGMSLMSLAGERTEKHLQEGEGIGTYKMKLIDDIFNLDDCIWEDEVRLI